MNGFATVVYENEQVGRTEKTLKRIGAEKGLVLNQDSVPGQGPENSGIRSRMKYSKRVVGFTPGMWDEFVLLVLE